MFVEIGDMPQHRGLNRRQQIDHGARCNAQRFAHRQCSCHVKTNDSAGSHTQLAAKALGEIPNLPAL